MRWGKRNRAPQPPRRLPVHIAIKMDGNGRWAQKRGLPRTAGHAVGSENFRKIATYCKEIGVQYLTVYAFSTENWKRPREEVEAIMGLLSQYLTEAIEKMEKDRINMTFFGDLTVLPEQLREKIRETERISARYDGMKVQICFNYGSRDELRRAAERFARDCVQGRRKPEELTEQLLETYLYSAGVPDPDLVIHPGGECRLSNFLLWQTAYAEYYFTDVLWPDFTPAELEKAIADYSRRDRRFGGLSKK